MSTVLNFGHTCLSVDPQEQTIMVAAHVSPDQVYDLIFNLQLVQHAMRIGGKVSNGLYCHGDRIYAHVKENRYIFVGDTDGGLSARNVYAHAKEGVMVPWPNHSDGGEAK